MAGRCGAVVGSVVGRRDGRVCWVAVGGGGGVGELARAEGMWIEARDGGCVRLVAVYGPSHSDGEWKSAAAEEEEGAMVGGWAFGG